MNHNFLSENIYNTDFFKNTPNNIVKDTLLMLIKDSILECSSSTEISFLESKFNSYKKNPTQNEWYGFFCELVFRDWIKGLLKSHERIIFAQKNNNDLEIKTRFKSYSIEVKAIKDNDFDRIKKQTIQIISKVPSGKFFSVKLIDNIDPRIRHKEKVELFQDACNELINVIKNDIESDKWKVKVIGRSKHSNTTGLIGFSQGHLVDVEFLEQVINNHLFIEGKIRKQIKKADILCFYFFNTKFHPEDILFLLEKLPQEFENKVIGYFTEWQQGKPNFFIKKETNDKTLAAILNGYPIHG